MPSKGDSTIITLLLSEGFNFNQEYLFQEELFADDAEHPAGTQWALLQFEKPIICPLKSLVIGSRLETDIRSFCSNISSCTLSRTT